MQIPIFPAGSLSESVITTVWIGVFVICIANLRFGWTLSGLVIPGYIVPLLMVKPLAGLVVFIQGIVSYLLVLSLAKFSVRTGLGCNFFGRDRFFAIVLTSILVRVTFDGYLLPELTSITSSRFRFEYDFGNNLHSFGLIITSLVANQFWKPGLRKGIGPVILTVTTTYIIVKYVLIEYTNFSIGSFRYMYEDMASSIFASPKAYIVLVVTSFVSSRLNLVYSWDFNGILIPSLIAIQWYEPLKVVTSFIEAWVVFIAASRLLKLKCFKETTIEGARKVIFFFNVSFVYKMILGHVIARAWPQVQVSDFFGFGYLLPCLLAMKMHDKGIPVRITRTTLHASIVGASAAGLIGFSLTYIPDSWSSARGEREYSQRLVDFGDTMTLSGILQESRLNSYEAENNKTEIGPSDEEQFEGIRGFTLVSNYLTNHSETQLQDAASAFEGIGYCVCKVGKEHLVIRSYAPYRDWGIYIFNTLSASKLVLEVPYPRKEAYVAEAAGLLFKQLHARSVAIASELPSTMSELRSKGAFGYRDLLNAYLKAFGDHDILQIRGYTAEQSENIDSEKAHDTTVQVESSKNIMWIRDEMPESLKLSIMKQLIPTLHVEWKESPGANAFRRLSKAGIAELFIEKSDRRRLLANWCVDSDKSELSNDQAMHVRSGTTSGIGSWIAKAAESVAEKGSNKFSKASFQDLLYFDEEILTPISNIVKRSGVGKVNENDLAGQLLSVSAAAKLCKYTVSVLTDERDNQSYVCLSEQQQGVKQRNWGTYVWRLGTSKPFTIAVPRPGYEASTLGYGLRLFAKLHATAFIMAGAHPKCNTDNSADVVLFENRHSLYNLVHQVVHRTYSESGMCTVQIRALGYRLNSNNSAADAIVATCSNSADTSALKPLSREVISALKWDGLDPRLANGDSETSGYEVTGSAQYQYMNNTKNGEFVSVWLSPMVRAEYRIYSDRDTQNAQFQALGVCVTPNDQFDIECAMHGAVSASKVPDELPEMLLGYAKSNDINVLYKIQHMSTKMCIVAISDTSCNQLVIVILVDGVALPMIARATGTNAIGESQRIVKVAGDVSTSIDEFCRGSASVIVIDGDK